MSYLPAPYEAAQQDDLPAALGAGLAVTLAGITSWVLGRWAWDGVRTLINMIKAGDRSLPKELVVPTAGWAISVLLMVLGALLLIFRRGRGLVVFAALLSVATTALARYSFGFGSSTSPVAQWALYWGGVAVLLAAVLPATGRWIIKRAPAPVPYPATATYLPR